jgi:hypothetical protein
MNFKKVDYIYMLNLRIGAFVKIGSRLEKDHPLMLMMGSLSYGRHAFETGPNPNLQDAVRAMSGLDGIFEAMKGWARANDPILQRMMLSIYPKGFTTRPY